MPEEGLVLIQGYRAGELSGNNSSDISRVIADMHCYMETRMISAQIFLW